MSTREFYEAYWRKDQAPPQGDPTTAARMVRLQSAISALLRSRTPDAIRVLDAGCGDGEFLACLHRLGCRVSGIDVSSVAIQRARQRCPDADVRVGSLEERLPFDDASFDAIWCTEVLEHLFDVHGMLAECNRALRYGGALILTTPYHGLVKNLAIAVVGFDRHFNPDLSHIRFFARSTLGRCLRRAGFEPSRWSGVGRVWPLWKSFFVVATKVGPAGPAPEIAG